MLAKHAYFWEINALTEKEAQKLEHHDAIMDVDKDLHPEEAKGDLKNFNRDEFLEVNSKKGLSITPKKLQKQEDYFRKNAENSLNINCPKVVKPYENKSMK